MDLGRTAQGLEIATVIEEARKRIALMAVTVGIVKFNNKTKEMVGLTMIIVQSIMKRHHQRKMMKMRKDNEWT